MSWRGTCLNPGVTYLRLALFGATSLAIFSGACSTSPKPAQKTASDGRLFAITAEKAPFFHRGPQPGREPDSTLARDTVVRLIRPSFGYSKVQVVATGEQGYVASEELKPASPAMLVASVNVPPADSISPTPSETPAGEQFKLNSSDPRLVPPPEVLPDPDLPPPLPGQ